MQTNDQPIYLDYAATTPLDERVQHQMVACFSHFGNPASLHGYGQAARELINTAREQVASLIHADPSEILWTSGATESNNMAIKGIARLYQRKGKHIITMKTEHKAVLDPCQYMEKEGYSVTYLAPEPNGLLDMGKLAAAIRPDTILVSIMHVNNETGIVQDIQQIAEMTSARGILLHVDAAQSSGKADLDVRDTPIDLLSLSAHKAYGPKGVGALYLRKKPRVRVEPLIHGGGHEQGMRSGTLPTHQIVGMGAAFMLISQEGKAERQRIHALRDRFVNGLNTLPVLRFNTDLALAVPHILNVRFDGMLAEAILAQLPSLATSTASACQGKGTEGSYVLRAMGLTEEEAKSAVRFSFGRFTTNDQLDDVVKMVCCLFDKQ